MNLAEDQNVEWKSIWKDDYLKWICGFANAQGGKMYFGIDDDGTIVGLDDAKKLLEDIPNKIRDVLGIMVDVNLVSEGAQDCIEVVVNPSSYPINYRGEYHYRSGSTKQILKGAALTEFLTSKTGHTWDDMPVDKITVEDLDTDSFELFRKQAFKSSRMDERDLDISNEQLLENLGLIKDDKLIRAAVLLFHKQPEKIVKGSYIKVGFFKTDADLLYQDEIHGSLFGQAEKIIDLLYTKYFKGIINYEGITRIEKYPFPKEAIREALFNAIIHKDYSAQIPIQVSVYEDKLYISNDCIFPTGWTVETLMQKHRSKPYNPNIANGFFRAGLVETWGRGIEKICEACRLYGLKDPEWTVHAEDIMVLFTANQSLVLNDKTSDKNHSIQPLETSDKNHSIQSLETSDKNHLNQSLEVSDNSNQSLETSGEYINLSQALKASDHSNQPLETSDKNHLNQSLETSDKNHSNQSLETSDKNKRNRLRRTENYYNHVLAHLLSFETATTREISELLTLSVVRTRAILNDMVEMDLLESEGNNKTRAYRLKAGSEAVRKDE